MLDQLIRAAKALAAGVAAALFTWIAGIWILGYYYSFMETGQHIYEGAGMTRYLMLVSFLVVSTTCWLALDDRKWKS